MSFKGKGRALFRILGIRRNQAYSGVIFAGSGDFYAEFIANRAAVRRLPGEGTLFLGHNLAAVTTTVDSAGDGGTLNLTGSRTITGNLTLDNAGSLGLGANTLTLGGTGIYTQGSGTTLNLTVDTPSTSGRITSGAAAVVNTASTVAVTVSNDIYIPSNATFTIIDTNGSGIGNAPTTVTSSNSRVSFSASNSGGNLVLTADRSTSGFESQASSSNSAAVGRVLDNISNPSSDMTTILNTLEALSGGGVASAENDMGLSANRGVINTSNGSLDKFVRTTVLRLQDSKIEEDSLEEDSLEDSFNNDIWFQSYGGYARQGERGASKGYRAKLWGNVIGFDHGFLNNSLRLGIDQGFSEGKIRSKDNEERTRITSYQTGLYGEYSHPDKPYLFDAVLTYGYSEYNNSRKVTVGSIERTANADYDGQQLSAYLEGGYKLKKKNFEIIPLLALSYTNLELDDYTETGAGALNLSVESQNYQTLQLGGGLRLSKVFESEKMLFTPELRFRYFYSVVNEKQQSLASFEGGGASFETSGYRPAPSSFNVGSRFEFFNKKNTTLLVDLETQLKEDFYELGGSVTYKVSF
ncbi:MAG: autotransporter domain-containing protein [Candidatus Omnitrophica bacterium]|nr:autotransporter domain-containing protein [Candidatus Omnitrophota bacterium]